MNPREMQAVLAWSALPFVGERIFTALLGHAREGRRSLAALWESPVEDLRALVRLHPRTVAALSEERDARWEQAAADRETVLAQGIDLLLAGDPEYPAALRKAPGRWPLVFAYGALGLLEEPRVALVNSSTVSHAGLAMTDALADALARRDVALVTSTNREAYQAAAIAAKRHAGPAILVLDRGIAEAFPSGVSHEPVAPARVWDEAFDPELQLLLAPFALRERWSPRSGPRRDALIQEVADVIVAVDIRAGGNIDRECRRALRHGRKLIAVDRGEETCEGTRRLWDEDPRVVRLSWSSADAAADRVLRELPGWTEMGEGERPRQGWQREIGHFLARACDAVSHGRPRAVAAYPAAGPLQQIAAAWSPAGQDGSAGVSWLLADLTGDGPGRMMPLLQRVARGGLLAAIAPAAWLEDAAMASERARWLEQAALRLVVRLPELPAPSGGSGSGSAALLLLERDGELRGEAAVFAPEQPQMGRFHLRRYLQEVLAALGREGLGR